MTKDNSSLASGKRMIAAFKEIQEAFSEEELSRMRAADLLMRMAIIAQERIAAAAHEGSA